MENEKSNKNNGQSPVMLIPYQCGDGASKRGAGRGPSWLKEDGLETALSKGGREVVWHDTPLLYENPEGTITGQNILQIQQGLDGPMVALINELRKRTVLQSNMLLKIQTAQAIEQGYFPVTIGGDHSMVGSFAATAKAHDAYGDTGILWVDAHGDFNTPESSPSGSLHGMSLAVLCGLGDPEYVRVCSSKPVVNPEHACLFGARDLDDKEINLLARHKVRVITMDEIRLRGLEVCFDEALEIISKAKCQMLSFDIDSMDGGLVPATGTPVAGGFGTEIFAQLSRLKDLPNFAHAAFAEFNPAIGTPDQVRQTANLLTRAIHSTLYGRDIL